MDNIEQEEFELGENVTDQVRRGKPSGVVVSVRLSPEDAASLMDLAEESGRTVSQVARQAIRYFLSEQRGQPLGFAPEITGNMPPYLDIYAAALLGPRSVSDSEGGVVEGGEEPSIVTGPLDQAA